MSRHDDSVRLRHMIDAARRAVALAGGKTREQVAADEIDIVEKDLPPLIAQLEQLLASPA